jgi:hypothetical protein
VGPTRVVVVVAWLCVIGLIYGTYRDVFISRRQAPWATAGLALLAVYVAVDVTRRHVRAK